MNVFRTLLCFFFFYNVLATPLNNQKCAQGSRIVNGDPAKEGQFPWQIALLMDGFSFCGGSLISEEWIVTAGHCVAGGRTFQIILGTTTWRDGGDGRIVRTTTDSVVHHDYNPNTLENDIALVKLETPLSFTAEIQPIRLGNSNLPDGSEVTVSGWGRTKDGGAVSDSLNYVSLETIKNTDCDEYYGPGEVKAGMVCAVAFESALGSTCNGDSGGPLVTNPASDPVLVGVVSFVSIKGCESGYPSGYTRTASYRDWIIEITGV